MAIAGLNKAKARRSSRKKAAGLNARQKAGLPAKAGRRRPPHIKSVRDARTGKRDWVAA